jgi:hypothetical protein
MSAEELAILFHDTYEQLAPTFGYETRKDSAKPWSEVPDKNKNLMIAVCAEILRGFSETRWNSLSNEELKAVVLNIDAELAQRKKGQA